MQGEAEKQYGFEDSTTTTSGSKSEQASEIINSPQVSNAVASTSISNGIQGGSRPVPSGNARHKRMAPNKEQNGGGQKSSNSKISENLLQINVFFQTLNVQTIAEEPKYEVG